MLIVIVVPASSSVPAGASEFAPGVSRPGELSNIAAIDVCDLCDQCQCVVVRLALWPRQKVGCDETPPESDDYKARGANRASKAS